MHTFDDEEPKSVTDADLKSGKFVIVMRRNGKVVRDKDGVSIPRSLHQHKKIQSTVDINEMQKEATQLFSE